MSGRCDAMVWAAPSGCDGCGQPLSNRAKRWCRDGCDELYWTNHRFGRAREVALYRARVRAGIGWRFRCERCHCTTTAPEVNHRVAALGSHAQESCAHHQENLEVLCRSCHLAETKAQRDAGLFGHRPKSAPSMIEIPLFGQAS